MKWRNLSPQILAALRDTPVVYLQGPRQAGKSTLAQAVRDDGYDAEYFTLDDAATLAAAQSDPDGFIGGLPERVILDEVQRVPELFRAVKRSVDAKRKPGRFLLTGSAQALVLPKVSESLAGRMEVLTLWPFSQGEIAGRKEGFVDACFARDFKPGKFTDTGWPPLTERIATGGYPEVLTRTDAARRQAWFGSYDEASIVEQNTTRTFSLPDSRSTGGGFRIGRRTRTAGRNRGEKNCQPGEQRFQGAAPFGGADRQALPARHPALHWRVQRGV